MDGAVIETEKALVTAMNEVYLGVFEGIRAYVAEDVLSKGRLNIFRWGSHMERLWHSAAVCGITIPYTREQLLEATRDTIRANGFTTNAYIQPRLWPKAGIRRFVADEFHILIPVWTLDTLLGSGNPRFSEKTRTMVSSWRRIPSDAMPAQAKCWANYANSALAAREAARLGYDEALFLDSRGFVSEGTGACVVSVRDGKLITPPVTASILESVTRSSILKFAPEDLGIPVEVRDISRVELYASDEAFFCGTGWEVKPITSVDDIRIGDEHPGPLTRRIAEYYGEIVAGKVEKRRNWLTPA
jgi:branched-chain amino acid aminotransferase